MRINQRLFINYNKIILNDWLDFILQLFLTYGHRKTIELKMSLVYVFLVDSCFKRFDYRKVDTASYSKINYLIQILQFNNSCFSVIKNNILWFTCSSTVISIYGTGPDLGFKCNCNFFLDLLYNVSLWIF